jgi:hypothetical protein
MLKSSRFAALSGQLRTPGLAVDAGATEGLAGKRHWGNLLPMSRILAIILLGWVSACASASSTMAERPADLSCNGAGANTYYIPAGDLDIAGAADPSDAFVRQWYSAYLAAMNEPSLSCGDATADETYRFLWLRSFHQPVAVRISRTGRHFELAATVLTGHGGYQPGHIAQRVRRELTEAEWVQVMRALEHISFWEMPATTEEIGVDGAQWIIEGRSSRYHVVDRWDGGDGVAMVGQALLDLADIRIRGPVY